MKNSNSGTVLHILYAVIPANAGTRKKKIWIPCKVRNDMKSTPDLRGTDGI